MKIGLLEDNLAIADLITMTLTLAGHGVVAHTDGMAFLKTFQTPLPYHLLVVDLKLKGEMSGIDVIQELRKSFASEALPIIVASAASTSELTQIQADYPNISILRKPFSIRALLQLIEQQNCMRSS